MLKAVVKNGAILPLEPLPADWNEGTGLEVEKAEPGSLDVDEWAKMMDRLCADSTAAEEARMQAAIDEHRRQAKMQVRREMGLSE
jgi:hypothetical protein